MTATKRTTPHVMLLGRFKSLLVVVVAVGFAACGQDDGPLSPIVQVTAQNPATVTIDGVELLLAPNSSEHIARFGKRVKRQRCRTAVRKNMTNNGGTLAVCGAQLTVHKGSFPHTRRLWMRTDPVRDDGLWSYEFGPHGTQFRRTPATLTIQVSARTLKSMGIDPDRLSIAYVTGQGHGNWQVIGVDYDWDSQTISAPVWHFSRYALCIE